MYRIAICDDEPTVCASLYEMLTNCTDIPTLAIELFYSGEDLCAAVEAGRQFDLFILDIELKSMNGVQVGAWLRKCTFGNTIQLLFISAESKYARELFDVHAFNFLIKPLEQRKVQACLREIISLASCPEQYFEFTYRKTLYRIKYRDIRYFESDNKTVIIHSLMGEQIVAVQLVSIINSSPPPPKDFVQIHQSYFINFEYIKKLEYAKLTLDNDEELPISYPYRQAVRDYLVKRSNALRERI